MAKGPPPRFLVKSAVAIHNLLYRASGGRIGGRLSGAPVLLLKVKGRKSGALQTVPLLYVTTDKGFALIASFAGSPKHPAWYLNLEAAGIADVQIRSRRIRVRAETVDPDSERYRQIWRDAVALYPDYDTYQTRTTRQIPVVELVPLS
ncbi:MAG TPA: nitroreductase family deazaflavin-dependent oxidoreductase [Rhizomicrobium sp.]|nr:nitroreductase family deazaflavin-dependent oxidoreductase [Rhizomicrobium sp.]